MGFDTEPTDYEKTILSDLQGAWQCLRQEVADNPGFDGWERALFHIDEAMCSDFKTHYALRRGETLLWLPGMNTRP